MTKPSKSRAISLLRNAKDQAPTLKGLSIESAEFQSWRHNTETSILNVFGDDSRNLKKFQKVSFRPYIPPVRIVGGNSRPRTSSSRDKGESFENGLKNADWLLESMITDVQDHWPEDKDDQNHSSTLPDRKINSESIFVVHGRDNGARETVARFIEQLELKAVILEEQPSKGRTVISKFIEEASDIGFAVVLLTPDDEGRPQGDGNEIRSRARQNVVLELGFFLAALGQERVCALLKGDVELPSDYDGVIYIPMDDANSWKFSLVKEFDAVGFKVDANKLLKTDKGKTS